LLIKEHILRDIYGTRKKKLAAYMKEQGIALLMFSDFEDGRDRNVRYMSGMPSDALYFLTDDCRSLLIPWDINMADKWVSGVDTVFPYDNVGRQAVTAAAYACNFFKIATGSRVEIPSSTSYPDFLDYVDTLSGHDVVCRRDGAQDETRKLRSVKDSLEISIYEQAAAITNMVIDRLEENVREGKIKTEFEAAMFIDMAARSYGCEGTGFDTLAAGPERSFAIHAFPNYTDGPFGTAGLSILDFGLNYKGYTTDVTMTFARDPLTDEQKNLLALVEKGYETAITTLEYALQQCKTTRDNEAALEKEDEEAALAAVTEAKSDSDKKGKSKRGKAKSDTVVKRTNIDTCWPHAQDIAAAVDRAFGRKKMPHTLGHGVGLDCHEYPRLSSRPDNEALLRPGMIITLEPGLYDPKAGGVRWENDFIVKESSLERLTNSRIVRL
jgi:Xaa-Pro dipeptidase